MSKSRHEQALKTLQRRLLLIQQSYARNRMSGIVVLEGWDAAGKGGIIRRIGWALDPRALRVIQVGAPQDAERREHWMQRFWRAVPEAGQLAIFDRSWYGRVLVERIEGFATPPQWRRAYREIREFETSLTDEGVRLVKLLLDIEPETQLRRFRDRLEDPAKRWKLTEDDLRNRARWDAYREAYEDMLRETSTPDAPWRRIDANHKHRARVDAFEEIVTRLGDGVDLTPPEAPPSVRDYLERQPD